ncbi:MAG: hypothetical protein ACOVSR_07720 [Bacteroidia bacterium]
MTDYEKELYRNWNNINYLEKNASNYMIVISNKIKKTSGDGPYIDSDIAEFIYQIIKNQNLSAEEIEQRVKLAIRHIKKGDEKIIFDILIKKSIKDS